MFRHYFRMTLEILLLLGIYWLSLLPLIVIRTSLEQNELLLAGVLWLACAAVFLPFLINIIVRRSWFFSGKGDPVVYDLLHSMLLGVNDYNGPVKVHGHGKKLVFFWNREDSTLVARMGEVQITKLYELHIEFDVSRKTAIVSDRFRKVRWDFEYKKMKVGWIAHPKLIFKIDMAEQWNIDNWETAEPQTFHFSAQEIKSPLINTILRNGWNVQFSLL